MTEKDYDEMIESVNAYIEEKTEGEETPVSGEERDATQERLEIREERTLYGTPLARADKRNVVAYCRKHKGYITENQMRRKECLKKQCFYLEKIDNPFWEEREKKKAAKKKKRAERGY